MEQGLLRYGDEKIEYSISRLSRLENKIQIHVHPSGKVEVCAPDKAARQDIQNALKKRSRWIKKQKNAFENLKAFSTPRTYVSGETHFYLGKRYLLKVIKQKSGTNSVRLLRGYLIVTTSDVTPKCIKQQLAQWYRARAEEYFQRRLNILSPLSKSSFGIKLQQMKRQWGSCSPKGMIRLNPALVKAPRECIDYVIIHELCHLKEHNHSSKFYRLLTKAMPNWKIVKEKLDLMAELIMI